MWNLNNTCLSNRSKKKSKEKLNNILKPLKRKTHHIKIYGVQQKQYKKNILEITTLENSI